MKVLKRKDETVKIITGILSLCLAYAVLRYHIFKGVDWQHFPLYILNKVAALASVVLFVASGAKKWTGKHLTYSASRMAGFALVLAVIHALMSVVLLHPERYPQFYETAQFSLAGESSLTAGILALVCLLVLDRKYTYRKFTRQVQPASDHCQAIIRITWFFLLVHLLTMGLPGWMTPADWPGYLLPISLIAFLLVMVALKMSLNMKRDNTS